MFYRKLYQVNWYKQSNSNLVIYFKSLRNNQHELHMNTYYVIQSKRMTQSTTIIANISILSKVYFDEHCVFMEKGLYGVIKRWEDVRRWHPWAVVLRVRTQFSAPILKSIHAILYASITYVCTCVCVCVKALILWPIQLLASISM